MSATLTFKDHPNVPAPVPGVWEMVGRRQLFLPAVLILWWGGSARACVLVGRWEQRVRCLTADPQFGEQAEEQGHAVLGV